MPRSLTSQQGAPAKPPTNMAVVPDTGYLIPHHVMGRNIDDPLADVTGNRRIQRPRLGVRVPYRNLTSQIVTQDEIAQEILQRSLRRNPVQVTSEVKDVFFAMKLTHRLAKTLTGNSTLKQEHPEQPGTTTAATGASQVIPKAEHSNIAQRKNELGSSKGIIDLTQLSMDMARTETTGMKFMVPKMDPELERQLALKQLEELPSLKKPRRRRSEPGPADSMIVKTIKTYSKAQPTATVPNKTPTKRKPRKPKAEVERGIQAGTSAIQQGKTTNKAAPKRKSAPAATSAKKSNKAQLVNGSSPAKVEPVAEDLFAAVEEEPSPKRRSKQSRELDMLLGDEGAVNMIYEAEHGPKQKTPKKNQQELKLKARLVRNAVLRLSSGPLPSRPRGRRKSSPPTSPSSEPRSPQQQTFQPKLPLPAEASRIIRRHSSDSEFSSRSASPQPTEPLTIIPGPRKKKGVPIYVKKVERTYKGKKKPAPDPKSKINPKLQLANKKMLRITPAVKNKLTDEMSRNFQQAVSNTAALISPPPLSPVEIITSPNSSPNSPNRRRKQELETRVFDAEDAKIILEDDPTLRSLEAQLAAVVGEPLEETTLVVTSFNDEEGVTLGLSPHELLAQDMDDVFAPSTSSGGVMRSSPNCKSRQSVRQNNACSYREINTRRYQSLVQIILTPNSSKSKNCLSIQVLRELKDILMQLKKDDSCKVVLFASTGSNFCHGIDVQALLHCNVDKRKKAAQDMATALKEFIKALASFTKPLAAAVQGPAVGLGVTMLPYFDMVFASDKALFYTTYTQLGQVPEGAVSLTFPTLLGPTVASDLLFCCRKLTASEAKHCGLVTRIIWPDKFQEELIPTLCSIAAQSAQALEGTKQLLRESLLSKLDAALESESQLLIQNWCSVECQTAFKNSLENDSSSP